VGSDSFTYIVKDNDGAISNSATVSITVNEVCSIVVSSISDQIIADNAFTAVSLDD
jgi:hypothetical protein